MVDIRETLAAPRLSFVVPAYNEQEGLPATLVSIHHAAAACGVSYEIVVADDASTDDTVAVASKGGARVVRVAHRQIAATRNAGARAARGESLVFVDADTRVDAEVVRATLGSLDSGAVGGGAAIRFDEPVPRYARALVAALSWCFRLWGVAAGCYLYCTRRAFDATGGFDERLYGSEEIAMSRALKRHGRFVVLREAVETSGRKVRVYRLVEILRMTASLLAAGPGGLRRRDRLEFWYGARRTDPRPPG